MEIIKEKIQKDLPSLSNEDDLKYVEEKDLCEILKPIPVRKLLKSWKILKIENLVVEFTMEIFANTSESVSSLMDKSLPMETGCTSKQNENEHDQHSYSNTDPNWAFKFNIPWDLMPKALLQSINKSERPSAQLRRQMVRIIVSHIHGKCKNPRKNTWK
ncbi:hypothetical protein Avbf_17735 [Armadillidium vulgare]|nr:hypothetical protein Avbf_17735 [Armadillidium vulgare]